MGHITIDFKATSVPTIGVADNLAEIGIELATAHPDKPTIVFTLPTAEVPHLIGRLCAASARTAQLEAQARGEPSDAVAISQARKALPVTAAGGVTTIPGTPETIAVFAMTTDGAVIPLAFERPAAQALLAELAAALGH